MIKEMVDIVSFNDLVIGTEEKAIVHEKGLLHRAAHLWIARKEAGLTYIVLQKRGRNKTLMPGKYDVSTAGHIQSKESIENALSRECQEELGFTPDFSRIKFAGKRVELYEDKQIKNFEICYVYLYQDNRPLQDYCIGWPEVEAVCQVTPNQLLKLLHGDYEEIKTKAITGNRQNRDAIPIIIRKKDLIPRLDSYLERICEIVPKFIRGTNISIF